MKVAKNTLKTKKTFVSYNAHRTVRMHLYKNKFMYSET